MISQEQHPRVSLLLVVVGCRLSVRCRTVDVASQDAFAKEKDKSFGPPSRPSLASQP